jgi:hypothetical protein
MLLPSLVVYDVLRQRRIQPLTYKIFAVTVPLMALQNLLIHTDRGYGAQMTVTLANVLNNVRAYLSEFSVILTGNLPMLLRLGLLGVISLLVLWGWWQSVQRGITWFELLPFLLRVARAEFSMAAQAVVEHSGGSAGADAERRLCTLVPAGEFQSLQRGHLQA